MNRTEHTDVFKSDSALPPWEIVQQLDVKLFLASDGAVIMFEKKSLITIGKRFIVSVQLSTIIHSVVDLAVFQFPAEALFGLSF